MLEKSRVVKELNYADVVWHSSGFRVRFLLEQLVDMFMREKWKERDSGNKMMEEWELCGCENNGSQAAVHQM